MPEWIAETLKYVSPFGAFCLALIYLLMRDRKNNQRAGTNPGPPLTDGRWQQEMKQAQDKANDTLGRIEAGMTEACRLLAVMDDRQKRNPPP